MLRLLLLIFLFHTSNNSKATERRRGQARNDANGQIINSMGFHPVGQARVIRSVLHLREEANLQPLADAIKEISAAHLEYKKTCYDYGKTKVNFVIAGKGHREHARQVCAEKDMVIAQPFNQWLQKELNSLMNEHSLSLSLIHI